MLLLIASASKVVEEVKSLEISTATDAEDSTIVIERNQEQQQRNSEVHESAQTQVIQEEQKVDQKTEKKTVKVQHPDKVILRSRRVDIESAIISGHT